MVILVLGNGFDLAHELPTKYSNFLDFVEMYRDYIEYSTRERELPKTLPKKAYWNFIERIVEPKPQNRHICDEVDRCASENNLLLNWFLGVYQKQCKNGKDGWIDFEKELTDIIQLFDEARKILEQNEKEGKKLELPQILANRIWPFIMKHDESHIEERPIKGHSSQWLVDFANEKIKKWLDDITRLLEIYICEIVERMQSVYRIPEISSLKVDKVLSFNYSDTFQRLYDPHKKAEYCYVHGYANPYGSREDCNLVLGANEFLDADRKDQDNEFEWSKKFFQRIIKETNQSYDDWLRENKSQRSKGGAPQEPPVEIYFYGHSLDKTDRGILRELILFKGVKTRIFYITNDMKSQLARNLIRIIDEDNLIRLTKGRNPFISFRKTQRVATTITKESGKLNS